MTTIRDSIRAFKPLLFLIWVVPAAIGLYCLAAYVIVVRGHVIAPSHERIICIKEFLDSQAAAGKKGDICFLGSSVTIEGLDCDIVDRSLPAGIRSYNLGWTGAGPRQWLLMGPALRASRPGTVVMCTGLGTIMQGADLRPDTITIAATWRFLPDAYLKQIEPLLTPAQYEQLKAPMFQQLLALRSFPPEAADTFLQEVSRADLRYAGYVTNFKSPWVRRESVDGEKRSRELHMQRNRLRSMKSGDSLDTSVRIVRSLVSYLQQQDCRVILLLDPMNPEVTRGLEDQAVGPARRTLADLAKETGALFWDHSGILDQPDDFADSVHPSLLGRQTWSAALGRALHDLPMPH
ncbi:MAG: hypothetical protein NTV86_15895 [Planctomycetota bacterium]|nr:hypothetical protein [Planctomycetota bacterium]